MKLFPIIVGSLLVLAAVMWVRLDAPFGEPRSDVYVPPYRIEWRKWEPGSFEKARLEGKIVLLRFTADWSLAVLANEQRVFSDQTVRDRLMELEVIMIKADNTMRDQAIEEELKRFGRVAIPTNILAPADPEAEVIILPELLSPEVFLSGLEQASAAR